MWNNIWEMAAGGILGIASGTAVALGVSAFVITTGLFPRMIQKTETTERIRFYENVILAGIMLGCFASIYPARMSLWMLHGTVGNLFLAFIGLCGGIFTGCLAVALAEVLNVIPIMFRIIKPEGSGEWVLLFLALGKVAGSMYYFRDTIF